MKYVNQTLTEDPLPDVGLLGLATRTRMTLFNKVLNVCFTVVLKTVVVGSFEPDSRLASPVFILIPYETDTCRVVGCVSSQSYPLSHPS